LRDSTRKAKSTASIAMNTTLLTTLIWAVLGFLIAAVAWVPVGVQAQFVALWFLVLAAMTASKRLDVFIVILVYYLVTCRDVAQTIDRFDDTGLTVAWLLVAGYCTAISLLWTTAWNGHIKLRLIAVNVLLFITVIPPLGGFIVGTPMLATGWIFPGMGLWGLLFIVMSWNSAFAVLYFKKSSVKIASGITFLVLILISIVANLRYESPSLSHIYAINTDFSRYPNSIPDQYQRQIQLTAMAMEALKRTESIVVMPEEIAGVWQPRFAWMWSDVASAYKVAAKTLIVGFDTSKNQINANTAVIMGAQQAEIYAHVSAPVGGWKPWDSQHMPARWLQNSAFSLNGKKYAAFFCWEELVPWPWIHTAIQSDAPLTAVVLVNHWFSRGLDIGDSQARSTKAWARLFGWSYIRVVNEPQAIDVKTTLIKP
jgi:apolipoprotein N-acyltransferase